MFAPWPSLLFICRQEIGELAGALAFDIKQNKKVPVSGVNVFAFSSECDQLSTLNNFSRDSIVEGKGKSKFTFVNGMFYIEKWKPWIIIFEHVRNLDAPNSSNATMQELG